MLSGRTHPGEVDLLRYQDGELPARRAERVRTHVDACEKCRSLLDQTRRSLDAYAGFRTEMQEAAPAPPAPWANLYREFERIPAPNRFINRLRGARWLIGGVVVVCAAFVYKLQPPVAQAPPSHAAPAPPVFTPAKPIQPARVIPARRVSADDEMQVIAALHGIGADLGEPVSVVRRPGEIVVTALGLDPERAARLRTALARVPDVSLRFSAAMTPASPAAAARQVVGSAEEPIIARRFPSREAYERFVDGVLARSDAMMTRVHALLSLADRFPPEQIAGMSVESRQSLAEIRRQHMAALAREAAAIDASVRPLLPQVPDGASNAPRSATLFQDCEDADRLLAAVFAGVSGAPRTSAEQDLAQALDRLRSDLQRTDMN